MIFFSYKNATSATAEGQKEDARVAAPFTTLWHAVLFAMMVVALAFGPGLIQRILPADRP
jgi:hypothetical protein